MQERKKTKYTKPQTHVIIAEACSLMSGSEAYKLNGNGKGDASEAMSNRQNNLWNDNWDEKTGNWMK